MRRGVVFNAVFVTRLNNIIYNGIFEKGGRLQCSLCHQVGGPTGSSSTTTEGEWITGRWSPVGWEAKWKEGFLFLCKTFDLKLLVPVLGGLHWPSMVTSPC